MSDSINTSEDGYIGLSWDSEAEGGIFELQESTSVDFESYRVVYKGPDLATFVSGLENGQYFYRVRRNDGAWSSPIELQVKHHTLQLAFSLFGLGALVFVLTAWVIIKGTREQSDKTN